MFTDDAVGNRKPQTRTLIVLSPRKKWFKDLPQNFFGHPAAIIGYSDGGRDFVSVERYHNTSIGGNTV
tara:strand:+ start:320 stop:523 length:204 start_codon:yes stop_codon:yes gene_type:complete